jgi:6-phosphofructokinase 1
MSIPIGKIIVWLIIGALAGTLAGRLMTFSKPGFGLSANVGFGMIGAVVSAEIERCTGKESRVCVLGHLQRGGSPTTFDRALCSMFGATAVELVAAGEFGKMVAFNGPQIGAIRLSDAIGKIKTVRANGNLVRTARALGICFGD